MAVKPKNISEDNLSNKLTNGVGFLYLPKIDIELYEITKTNNVNSFTFYETVKVKETSLNNKDSFDGLVAKIEESDAGDYYVMYGEYNGIIYEDFVNKLNLLPNSNYSIFHEVTVNEQLDTDFIETYRSINVQTNNFGKPFKFRPIIENSNAVSYSIQYVLRLINSYDGTQIIKAGQIISYDVKKYGKKLKKINLGITPVIDKIYNKIENIY